MLKVTSGVRHKGDRDGAGGLVLSYFILFSCVVLFF